MAHVSLSLRFPDSTDATATAELHRITDAATQHDGYRPFNEQALLDAGSGRRSLVLLWHGDGAAVDRADGTVASPPAGAADPAAGPAFGTPLGTVVGAALIGDGEFDLAVDPLHRRHGYADAALTLLLPRLPEHVTAWSHGDHPAARVLAERHHFEATRTLLQLRLDPLPAPASAAAATTSGSDTAPASAPAAVTITPFVVGQDEQEWVELNALIFASHPEQGTLTTRDLADRLAEPWFDAGDFLIARDASGAMIGYNWLKIEPGTDGRPSTNGEIYVIGIHPDAAGHGLGRRLMERGLGRLAERGCTTATLYVEADNAGAVRLYRSLGFTDFTIDVQYTRRAR